MTAHTVQRAGMPEMLRAAGALGALGPREVPASRL